MPLAQGSSRRAISTNIRDLQQPSPHAPNGRPRKQAIAIALKVARAGRRPPLLVKPNKLLPLSQLGGV